MKASFLVYPAFLLTAFAIIYIIYLISRPKPVPKPKIDTKAESFGGSASGSGNGSGSRGASGSGASGGKCDKHTCGAADPVSDPAYNMMELVKQSILLEDHLANERKYCRDCVCKHMMAMEAYSEEALTLAGNKIDQYPMMKECPMFYQKIYQRWSKNKENVEERKNILTELREMRKKLMSVYLMAT